VPGLVNRDIKQADRRVVGLGARPSGLVGAWLPAYASDTEPDNLVAAEPAEQPDQGQCAQQFDRCLRPTGLA
jgi:hypothetical protein